MKDVIVAPFSHSSIRDWPPHHFAQLIGLLLRYDDLVGRVRLIGTANQRLAANEIARAFPADRVANECGRLAWTGVLEALSRAGCVIGNNSGVPHVAAFLGAPTVCVFGGSHERAEWRPRGKNVTVVSRAVGCSPCQFDHHHTSPYNKACLRGIDPHDVERAVLVTLRRAAGASAGEEELRGDRV